MCEPVSRGSGGPAWRSGLGSGVGLAHCRAMTRPRSAPGAPDTGQPSPGQPPPGQPPQVGSWALPPPASTPAATAEPRVVDWQISDRPVAYTTAVAAMQAHVEAIAQGACERVWLLEHPPIYTAGTSAKPHDLLRPDRFPVFATGRGGQSDKSLPALPRSPLSETLRALEMPYAVGESGCRAWDT